MKNIYLLGLLFSASISGHAQISANCKDTTVYLNSTGDFTIQASDLNNGSTGSGTPLTFTASQTDFTCADVTDLSNVNSLIISGVYDAGLTGGTPKGIELYVINDIADLSVYGIGSANNGGGTDGQEFTFPAVTVTAGTYIYVASEATQFANFFGFAPDHTSGSMGINGDDAVELFKNAAVIDVFGDINTDGNGETWEYLDGWAYRNNTTVPNNGIFNDANWTFSGINVFDGQSDNATSPTSFPNGTYSTPSTIGTSVTLTVTEGMASETCTSQIIVLDTLAPVITCIGGTPSFDLDGTGNLTITTADLDNNSTDNCSNLTLTLSQSTFDCTNQGINTITLIGEDAYGNIDSCSMDIMVNASNFIAINDVTLNDPLCHGGNDGDITITSTNTVGTTYSNDGGTTYGSTLTWNSLMAGSYQIIALSADGCTADSTVILSAPDSISASFVVVNETCLNDSIGEIDMTVVGGIGNYTFNWSNTQFTTEDLTNLGAGTYTIQITDANGCSYSNDTTITSGVDINLTYTVTGNTIESNFPFGDFEWMNCADNSIISNETNSTYTADLNGSYAAIISSLGCVDTTECIEISGIGFDENTTIDFNVYPNPTQGNITINLSNASNVLVKIIDINGKVIKTKQVNNAINTFDLSNYENGIYFVKIESNDKVITKKISLLK